MIGERSSKGLGNTFDNTTNRMIANGLECPFFRTDKARNTRYRMKEGWEFFDVREVGQEFYIDQSEADMDSGRLPDSTETALESESPNTTDSSEESAAPTDDMKLETSLEPDKHSNLLTHSLWGLTFQEQSSEEDGPLVVVDGSEVYGFKQVTATILYKLAEQNPGDVFTIEEVKMMLQDTAVHEASPESIRGAMHEITSRLRGFQKLDHVLYDNQKHTIGLRTDIPVNRRTPGFLE